MTTSPRRRRPSVHRAARGRSRLVATASVVGLLALAPGAAAMTGGNLVVNGDGESPIGPEWTPVAGSLVVEAYGQGGYPGPVLIGGGTFDGGARLLHPAGNVDTTINRQVLALAPDDQAAIDTGTVRARLTGYLGGYASQNDRIGVDAAWRDAAGTVLATQTLAPVTAAERGNVSGFLSRQDEQAVPAGARTLTVTLTGIRTSGAGTAHDGYADDLAVHLIGIPRLQKAFGVAEATVDTPVRLTYAIANSEDLEGKPGWSFVDSLPAGLAVASTSDAGTTCDNAHLVADGSRIAMAGDLAAGQAACTVAFDVTGSAPGTYASGAEQVTEAVGLHPPATPASLVLVPPSSGPPADPPPLTLPPIVVPPEPPAPVVPVPPVPVAPPLPTPVKPSFLRPALRADVSMARRVRAGSDVRLRVSADNPTTVPASRVRLCLRLPEELAYVSAGSRATRSRTSKAGTPKPRSTSRASGSRSRAARTARARAADAAPDRRCWTRSRLEPGGRWTIDVDARARPDAGGSTTVRVTATSPGAVRDATARRTVRVTEGDADANR